MRRLRVCSPHREGKKVSTQSEFNAALNKACTGKSDSVTISLVSADNSFDLTSALSSWLETENWRFSLYGYSYIGGSCILSVTIYLDDANVGRRSYTYTGDDSALVAALRACIRMRQTCLLVLDETEGDFDFQGIANICFEEISSMTDEYGCSVDSCGYNDEIRFVSLDIVYASEPEQPLEMVLPTGLTEILDSAFEGNTSIVSCVMPDGLVSIGARAFALCTGLETVYIPSSVTSIGEGAFDGCAELIIIGESGSAAYEYAVANGIDFFGSSRKRVE